MTDITKENIFTICLTTFLILGLYYMSNSLHSLWGLLLLLNLNITK